MVMLVHKHLTLLPFILTGIKPYNVTVKVKEGILVGNREFSVFNDKTYYAFYGVPYAQAPVGKLRFKNPKPVKHWREPLDATTEYHGACAQSHIVHKHGQYGFENCLYLNIYTPNLPHRDKKVLKPVIVWIHGYAFTSSFSHIHGADFLIDNNVIVVTVTHRLGAFGFLKMNETDLNANMGLKDIVIGLKFIKRNIHHFGGDKKQLTVMGSGSASTLLSLLLLSKYKQLFSKMILQSGSIFSPSLFHGTFAVEKQRLEKELKKISIKALRSATSKDIIQASQHIYKTKDIIDLQRPIVPFLPIIENESNTSIVSINTDEISSVLRNLNYSNMSILIGFSSQESISEVIPFIHNTNYLKLLLTIFKFKVPFQDGCKYKYTSEKYKQIANEIKNWYFKSCHQENLLEDFLKYISDLYTYPIYKFINLVKSVGGKIYVFKFNYLGNFNAAKATSLGGSDIKIKGAAQGDEICYILKCDPLWESYVKLRDNKYDKDRIFIESISQMWANFAKTGEPTSIGSFGNITWRPMTLKEDNVFIFGKRNRLSNSNVEQKMFSFWNDIYTKYYDPNNCPKNKDEF